VVRFNGGPQAAHHVVTRDGRVHCFSQFGAATLVPGVETYLTHPVAVDPLAWIAEANALASLGVTDAASRTLIDTRCVIVTPFHKHLNRIHELARGDAQHGSCGKGVGQALLDREKPGLPVLRVGDLADQALTRRRLSLLQHVKVDQAEQLLAQTSDPSTRASIQVNLQALQRPDLPLLLADHYHRWSTQSGVRVRDASAWADWITASGTVIFEGAQGVLLDRHYGFWPHITPSRTTLANVWSLLEDLVPRSDIRTLGVLRLYNTRHGAGPMVSEAPTLSARLPEPHNALNDWQGMFRVGHFDLVTARYALDIIGGVDGLALTHLDRLPDLGTFPVCTAYHYQGEMDGHAFFEGRTLGHAMEVHRVRMPPSNTLPTPDHQRTLTRLLGLCQPVLRPLLKGRENTPDACRTILDWVASAGLATPVRWISTGPSAEHKRQLTPTAGAARTPRLQKAGSLSPPTHTPVLSVRL